MMQKARLKLVGYPLSLFVPMLVPLGVIAGSYWLSPLIVFGALPVLGLLIGQDHTLPVMGLRTSRRVIAYLRALPRLYGLVWLATLAWSVRHAAQTTLSTADFAGLALSVGISSAIAVCTAHELLHRRSRPDIGIARLMTAGCLYGHMVVEHLHHHATLGTSDYGATAPKGTSAYRFAFSDFGRAFITAWKVEQARQRRMHLPWWHHKVLQDYALAGSLLVTVGYLWGEAGVLLFVGQAAFAIFLFELITYVHHYGLVRTQDEPTGPEHAWAHHCWITNCLTFNNTFHSDHHQRPWTPYYELHAMHGAPHLPASYFSMLVVALIPPLWFKLMHPRLNALEEARRRARAMPPWLATEHCT